jgi:hypothetical protein
MITKTFFLAKDPYRMTAPILHDHGPDQLFPSGEAVGGFLGGGAGPDLVPGLNPCGDEGRPASPVLSDE